MRKERIDDCKVARLELNEGQLSWLPRNPRLWTQDDIDGMKASIAEDPDFISDRPVLAVPAESGDHLVVFAHNLYTRAVTDLKIRTAPVVVYYPETDTDRETIRRRAMKDNGSLGSWDWEALANEWDDLPLTEWGIPAWQGENDEESSEKRDSPPQNLDAEPETKPFILKVTFPDADMMNKFVNEWKTTLEKKYKVVHLSESGGAL